MEILLRESYIRRTHGVSDRSSAQDRLARALSDVGDEWTPSLRPHHSRGHGRRACHTHMRSIETGCTQWDAYLTSCPACAFIDRLRPDSTVLARARSASCDPRSRTCTARFRDFHQRPMTRNERNHTHTQRDIVVTHRMHDAQSSSNCVITDTTRDTTNEFTVVRTVSECLRRHRKRIASVLRALPTIMQRQRVTTRHQLRFGARTVYHCAPRVELTVDVWRLHSDFVATRYLCRLRQQHGRWCVRRESEATRDGPRLRRVIDHKSVSVWNSHL
jgi:hypothetical protein